MPSKSERAYLLRTVGTSWAQIAESVSPEVASDPSGKALAGAKKNLSRAAKRWARARGMSWPPEPGQEVPERTVLQHQSRERWAQEYEACREPTVEIAAGAKRWAIEQGLPWPPPERAHARSHVRHTRQEQSYQLKAEGLDWETIRARVGYKRLHHAIEGARRWATANELLWPLPEMRGG